MPFLICGKPAEKAHAIFLIVALVYLYGPLLSWVLGISYTSRNTHDGDTESLGRQTRDRELTARLSSHEGGQTVRMHQRSDPHPIRPRTPEPDTLVLAICCIT
jgi:hypothetical protein